ncbi:MAG TPA: heme o synthase [Gemmataceae bacterium]|nr:heme o synthase [Gemmataceae bacterium]
MKSTVTVCADALPLVRFRFADYVELTRPRIAVMVLFTTAAGFALASAGAPDLARLFHTMFGTVLLVAGASALNQVLERHSDAVMERTRNRPVPAGRLQPGGVLLFGLILALAGLAYLALTVRQPLAIAAAGFAFVSYVFLYTPLKRTTTLNTLVGAIPGAMPPVIGWTAVTNSFGPAAAVLFAVLFLWQVPHFLAIAWIYRDDYARAGLRMLPVLDPSGDATARRMLGYCLALLLVSVLPSALGWAGPVYLLGAIILGGAFLVSAFGFWRTRSVAQARRVLRESLVYLPALLTVLLVEGVLKSWAGTR